jgi:N-acetylneuraminic acid mutarotase
MLAFVLLLLQNGIWATTPPMPDARQEVGVVAVEGRLYVIGGLDNGGQASSRVDVFDSRLNEWRPVPPIPIAVHHTMVGAVGHKIFVAGGYSNPGFTAHAQTYEFDPDLSAWTRKADMPSARGAGAAATYNGRLYVFGGERNGVSVTDVASYDPIADSWISHAPMLTPRNHIGAAEVRGKIYVVGGRPLNLANNEMFDPVSETWTVKRPMPTGRSGLAAAAVGSYVYVFGGEGNFASPLGTFRENEAYDVDADEWFTAQAMPLPRHGIGAGVIGNRVHIPAGSPIEGFGTTGHSDFFEVAQDIVLPQFVVGGGYRTEIVVSNPASRAADIQISLTDINGGPLTTLLDGAVRASMQLSLPPLASRSISAPDVTGPLRAGTVRIRANVRLNAFAVVRSSGISATTVYPVTATRSDMFQARLIRAESTTTGVAIANAGSESASLILTLVNDSGAEVARIERTIPVGGQLSRFIDELFTELQQSDFVGTMTIRSTRPVSIVALAFARDGVITIPVFPIE